MEEKELLTQRKLYKIGTEERLEEMPRKKIKQFYTSYPWVEVIVPETSVKQVHTETANPLLFHYVPIYASSWLSDLLGEYIESEIIFFLNEDGKTIDFNESLYERRFVFFGKKFHRNFIRRGKFSLYNKIDIRTLAERLGSTVCYVRYVVSYHPATEAVILYKVPKNHSLSEWMQMEIEKEKML